jgi:DNA helicase-2/ATP-dependent DNA helicase PcrA
VVAGWDSDTDKLLAELAAARSGEQRVLLPETLSATSVLRLTADPDGYAADLARPMPRPPSRAARFGTRFHSWVEHYFGPRLGSGGLGQQQLVDPDDLPDRVDGGTEDETELRELCEAFVAGRFGASTPYAIEAPFSLLLGGRLVRGRIDAVYRLPDDELGRACWRVVDWKTSRLEDADPLQLALYRLAWAEVQQVPLEQVDAVFYHVRSDQLVHPRGLGDRPTLEALLLDRA